MMVVAYGSCIIMPPSLQAAIHTFLAEMVDRMLGICNRTLASSLQRDFAWHRMRFGSNVDCSLKTFCKDKLCLAWFIATSRLIFPGSATSHASDLAKLLPVANGLLCESITEGGPGVTLPVHSTLPIIRG